MITDMLSAQHEKAFLKLLYEGYISKNGYGVRNLNNHPFYTSMMPKEIEIKISPNEAWYPTIALAEELSRKGLIRFHENKLIFFLTEAGYGEASKTKIQHIFDALNKNPGLLAAIAAIVALGSFVVSLCALFIGNDG